MPRGEILGWTALRGIAALWIVLHHFWPQTDGTVPLIVGKGYLAVDLFFILSGAVLALVYTEDLARGDFDFRRFAMKRLARLYPVHVITAVFAFVILVGGPMIGFAGRPLDHSPGATLATHLALVHAWACLPGPVSTIRRGPSRQRFSPMRSSPFLGSRFSGSDHAAASW